MSGQRPGFRGTVLERFWRKVQRTDECWLWIGGTTTLGYGTFKAEGRRMVMAHRFSYELARGQIPAGLHLDHLCRNPPCVNPAHLEPVTPRENILRGISDAAKNAAKTACPKGHPYDAANTYSRKGHRQCNVCRRAYWLSYERKSRAKPTGAECQP